LGFEELGVAVGVGIDDAGQRVERASAGDGSKERCTERFGGGELLDGAAGLG
jgi:hypothetical protein